ncbi:MAG: MBL fold metallo-hydrolase [Sutterellaceae bacterium]|nr:MBL fold metallo-hydrolase [Sutterellaceae bacterium]MDY2867485.1 MBL fold metallo-hydrolase [Mesosutterella sp.]
MQPEEKKAATPGSGPFLTRRALFACAAAGTVATASGCSFVSSFGETPEGEELLEIEKSSNWRDGAFRNQFPTSVTRSEGARSISETAGIWWRFLTEKIPDSRPDRPLHCTRTDLRKLPKTEDLAVWMAHSSIYLQLGGFRFLVDPVFFQGSPVPFINRSYEFEGGYPFSPGLTPDVDCWIQTHDHWDHLDRDSVLAMKDRVGQYVMPLGVRSHFECWGVGKNLISSLDWYDAAELGTPGAAVRQVFTKPADPGKAASWGPAPAPKGAVIYAFPARHFSGRSMKRDQTLWASFVIEAGGKRVYLSGDGGYDGHFREVGALFRAKGGFDLAFLECGQYNPRDWPEIHSWPEQVAQEATDLGTKAMVPIHNSRYSLARHTWYDPLEKITAASRGKPFRLLTPRIGDVIRIGDDSQSFPAWWKELIGKKAA